MKVKVKACSERSNVLSRSSACQVIKGLFTVRVNKNLGKQGEFTSLETGRFVSKSFCLQVDSPTWRSIHQLSRTGKYVKLFILSGGNRPKNVLVNWCNM